MIYRKVDCPHCGNEITVKRVREGQKCEWCRRLVKATFYQKRKGKKWFVEVEPMDFPEDNPGGFKKRNMNDWEDKDVYGFHKD